MAGSDETSNSYRMLYFIHSVSQGPWFHCSHLSAFIFTQFAVSFQSSGLSHRKRRRHLQSESHYFQWLAQLHSGFFCCIEQSMSVSAAQTTSWVKGTYGSSLPTMNIIWSVIQKRILKDSRATLEQLNHVSFSQMLLTCSNVPYWSLIIIMQSPVTEQAHNHDPLPTAL